MLEGLSTLARNSRREITARIAVQTTVRVATVPHFQKFVSLTKMDAEVTAAVAGLVCAYLSITEPHANVEPCRFQVGSRFVSPLLWEKIPIMIGNEQTRREAAKNMRIGSHIHA